MPYLQAINVSCDNDSWSDENDTVLPREDKLVDWLRQYLPLTCTIARDTYLVDHIRSSIRPNLVPTKITKSDVHFYF